MSRSLWLGLWLGLWVILAAGCKKPSPAAADAGPPPAMTRAVPDAGASTPAAPAELVARGAYLVRHVGACYQCHAERRFELYGAPVAEGGEGHSAPCLHDLPGTLCASNLTSHPTAGLGSWTDAEIARAIREGRGKDGAVLISMMPYYAYRALADEDVRAMVAFLRTLPPSAKEVPKDPRVDRASSEPFARPVSTPVVAPDRKDTVAYGKYLTHISMCRYCHSPLGMDAEPIPGQEFSGGQEFSDPGFSRVVSANLTPDPKTGIGTLTKEAFVARFKALANAPPTPAIEGRQSVMPWLAYAGMSAEDLGAIYDYLRTLPPVANKVVLFPDAK